MNPMQNALFVLLFLLTIAGCASGPPKSVADEFRDAQRIERVDIQRLLAGDLRYNVRILDGDVLIASDEERFTSRVNPPLGLIPDRVLPDRPMPPRYEMKAGDLLLVTIYELREPGVDHQQQARIDGQGRIRLQHVGTLPAAGLSHSELQRVLAQRLQDKGILRNATVSVQVLEAQRSYTLYLPGRASGLTMQFQKPDLRVSEVLDADHSPQLRSSRFLYLLRD